MLRLLAALASLVAVAYGAPRHLAPEVDDVAEASVSPFMQAKIHRVLGHVLKMDDDQVAELLASEDDDDLRSAVVEMKIKEGSGS